jgi:lauroyl/myristoyl acyltransferase
MLEYILYLIGEFLAIHLPLKLAYALSVFLSDIRHLFAHQDRRNVTANLKAIFPEKTDRQIARIRIQMFRNFSKYLVDFFRAPLLNMDYVQRTVRLENIHYLNESLAKNKGIVVVTAHLGNWELGGEVFGILGYPIACVALPHKNKKVDDFFNSRRENNGMHVIALGRAFRECLNYLKSNKIIALVSDRDFTESETVTEFLGKPAFLPSGPAVFALLSGSIILPTFMLRNPDDTFILKFEKPIDVQELGLCMPEIQGKHFNKPDQASIIRVIRVYMVVVEQYIKNNPQQWYNFRRFWKE